MHLIIDKSEEGENFISEVGLGLTFISSMARLIMVLIGTIKWIQFRVFDIHK
jgi:hypothetical protein